MFRLSIRRKIMGIAVALIVLMAVTSVLSMLSVMQVGERLETLTQSYIPAYGHLARANIRSLERAVALRQLVIEKNQPVPNAERIAASRDRFAAKGVEVEREMQAGHALIADLAARGNASDATLQARLDTRLETAMNDTRRHLNEEIERLLPLLDSTDRKAVADELSRIDALRGELNEKLDAGRAEMLTLLQADAAATVNKQRQSMLIAAALTVLAAALGLVFSMLVSSNMARPLRRLLEGARAIVAGRLDQTLVVTTQDEIGHLTMAFNRMVEQLRLKERIRETFGKYIDPRIVEGLIDRPALAAEGQRRVMTVLFCDVKGFTGVSERMTPQGLVKVMNRYFSTMSAPIRAQGGIIDKYIGDAIMAYWGPPFTDDADQARFACLAALDMQAQVAPLQAELPDLLGVRSVPVALEIRIGIATGEALVGSIGSDFMMSYTVMGDTVNLASRLEGANKVYGSRLLVSEETFRKAADAVEGREIDRIVTLGQTHPHAVFEIMGRKGELTAAQEALRSRFAEGLAAYRAHRWDEARRAFAAGLEAVPGDGPSAEFLRRIDKLAADPPAQDWNGFWNLEQK
jgi:adenylate cyclase